jgi:transposase
MELASMLAGERFSDRPRSVSPVIAAFLRGYNDLVDDQQRQDLIRYASAVVGTAASEEVERARATRLVQWADERWGQGTRTSVLGTIGSFWARRLPPTDPDSAGVYAIRSIHRRTGRIHEEVLTVLEELIAMGDRGAVQERPRKRSKAAA